MESSGASFDARAVAQYATGAADFGRLQEYGDKLAKALQPDAGTPAGSINAAATQVFSEMVSVYREKLGEQSSDMAKILLTHTFLEVTDKSGILDALAPAQEQETGGWFSSMLGVAQSASAAFGFSSPAESGVGSDENFGENLMAEQQAIREDYSAMLVEARAKDSSGTAKGTYSLLEQGRLREKAQEALSTPKTPEPTQPTPIESSPVDSSSATTPSKKSAATPNKLQQQIIDMAKQYTPDKLMGDQHLKGVVDSSARGGLSKSPFLAKGAAGLAERYRSTLSANLQAAFKDNPENVGRLTFVLEQVPGIALGVMMQTLKNASEQGKELHQITPRDVSKAILELNKSPDMVNGGMEVCKGRVFNQVTFMPALHDEIADNLSSLLTQKDLATAGAAKRLLGKVKALPIRASVEAVVLPMAQKRVKSMLEANPMTQPLAKFAPVLAAYVLAQVTNNVVDMAKNPDAHRGKAAPAESVVTQGVQTVVGEWMDWAGRE